MDTFLIRNNEAVKKLNGVLDYIEKEYNFKKDIKLYYIPDSFRGEDDYIAVKVSEEGNAKYFALGKADNYGNIIYSHNKNNPYAMIAEIENTINRGINLITDKELISTLENLGDKTYLETKLDKVFKPKVNEIKDTLDMVLEKISLPARSNSRDGFVVRDKLDAIDKVLKDSKYNKVYKSKHCVIYGLDTPKQGDKCILVSSHSDIVSNITNVDSQYKDGYYHGTYDNLGTNASAVSIMLRDDKLINSHIYFAFTDEEETCKCCGAEDALNFITDNSKINPLCVALDVTDEGFGDSLISIEGLRGNKAVMDNIAKIAIETDGNINSFNVVKASPKEYTPFDKNYISYDTTEFDESVYYGKKQNQNTVSFCVPTKGNMHSNSGLDIIEPAFIGYIYSLETMLQSLTLTLDKNKLFDIQQFKDYLTYKTTLINERPKPVFKSNYITAKSQFANSNEDEYSTYNYDLESAFELDDNGNILNNEAYEEAYETLMDFASSYPDDLETYQADVMEVYGDLPEDVVISAYNEFYGYCFDDNLDVETDIDDDYGL